MASNPLPAELAAQAESIVNTLTQTDYQYNGFIDAEAGIYDCDCNQFVACVLEGLAANHYALIPKESKQPLPRAFEYYLYFSGLGTRTGGWRQIMRLADARRGDVLAWELPLVKGQDTGHVVLVGDTPEEIEDGVWSVRVYDSADKPHFEDTREDGTSGVGSGFIRFEVDAEGRPTGFMFSPEATVFEVRPIAIGRAEPLG
ncbi:hypothetical protein [Granulicella tundricola]|uniref:Peptidase C51 domain-containing protein n=1 Tax=Granulicella tundricola (strain ATCC BAA-1859 / DSM 23138 / MP5ACTX9) TaxID=1198114 RepID=E8X364_GRATM|nr:hypothetical protein [Granulicella tundricola]ADW69288.1 hypothetical protein AciX9_2250 [Granulicella tundricola MP5ACTX9]